MKASIRTKNALKIIAIIFFFVLFAVLFYRFSYLLDIHNPMIGLAIWLFVTALFASIFLIIFHKKRKKSIHEYHAIASYRVFNRMQVCFYVACLISMISYFAIALLSDTKELSTYFLEMLLSYGGLMIVTIVLVYCMSHNYFGKLDRMSFFIVGLCICLTINILVVCDFLAIKWIYYLVNVFGTACMFSSTIMVYQSLSKVVYYVEEKKDIGMGWMNFRNLLWAILISTILVGVVLVIFYFTNEGIMPTTPTILLFFPAIFFVITLWFALMQPLNRHYMDLLDQYMQGIEDEDEKEMVRYNLQRRLVHSSRRAWVRLLIILIRPFFRVKVKNKKEVNTKDGPAIFIANHYEIYGPVVAFLRLPFFCRPWIISNMLDAELVEKQMTPGVEKSFKFLPKKIRKKIPKKFGKIFMKILKESDPIPVYRNFLRDLMKTMNQSVEALMGGDNLLIFPENAKQYKEGDIDPFYTGFAHLGKMYYEKTGKCITFYPFYISKKHKTLTFGKGIQYQASQDAKEEKKRIATELYQEMLQLKD